MSGKKTDQDGGEITDQSQSSLKRAVIAFAVVEALVLVPTILYLIFR